MNPGAWRSFVTLLVLEAAVVVAVVLILAGCSSSPAPPSPGPGSSSSPTRSTSGVVPAGVRPLLDDAWRAGRYGCGLTGPAVDGLAVALRDAERVPVTDARIVASAYVREQCSG